jgi:hypothetical protein
MCLSDVYLLLDVENIHFLGIEAGIYIVFVYFALKIRSRGKVTPKALIYSIVLRIKLVLLTLKIAVEE